MHSPVTVREQLPSARPHRLTHTDGVCATGGRSPTGEGWLYLAATDIDIASRLEAGHSDVLGTGHNGR
jgi:hypothetical protein